MPVITIRGQLGSGAPEIGKIIANRLHTDYVDREIIAEVAANLKRKPTDIAKKEMPPFKLTERIQEALSYSYPVVTSPEGVHMPVYLPSWEIPLDNERYVQSLETVIKKITENQTIVIRGRGSQFILKDLPSAFHILVVAPLDVRTKRVMDDLNLSEEDAKKQINRFDSSRKEFTKKYFRAELEDPVNYDIVVNTAALNFKDAATIVLRALQLKLKAVQKQESS